MKFTGKEKRPFNVSNKVKVFQKIRLEKKQMEIIYGVDGKIPNDGEEFERTLSMDVSSLSVVAFSSYFLLPSNKSKQNLVAPNSIQNGKSSFCVYVFSLEQPWHFCLVTTSNVPIVELVWNLEGTHLLICNQTGNCRIFKIKDGCINNMENVYQYETNEDILIGRFVSYKEPIVVNFDRDESLFYGRETNSSSNGNFLCITTSGSIHTLPLDRSVSSSRYSLSQQDPLNVSVCDLVGTSQGFNVVLGSKTQGALIHFFIVHRNLNEKNSSFVSGRGRGFRIPSCYGTLESIVYFQRNGQNCILTKMSSSTGDLIDLYEFNVDQQEWISITLLSCPNLRITSISLSPSEFFIKENDFQGEFARQMFVTLNDGSMLVYDKFTLKCKEHFYPLNRPDFMKNLDENRSEFFVRILHTNSGLCAVGLTESGIFVFLRSIGLEKSTTIFTQRILVDLVEQWIVQKTNAPDLFQIFSLIKNKNFDNSTINFIVDRLVQQFDKQTIEIKRTNFVRFKQALFHLHRLAAPFTNETSEHLTSLLVYQSLLIVRDFLRLFIYEPNNENFVDLAQKFLQQNLSLQTIDIKRIKSPSEQNLSFDSINVDLRPFQSISFVSLVNWLSDLIFYLIGYLQLQQLPAWLPCKNFFNDFRQIQWIRELIIYFYVLHKTNKISTSKISHLPPMGPISNENSVNSKEILNEIYQSITKFSQKLETQKSLNFDESFLDELSVFDVELLQSKADGIFPKSFPFLVPNNEQIEIFRRGQAPSFVDSIGTPINGEPIVNSCNSTINNSLIEDQNQDGKFDVISFSKIPICSTTIFRRCLRCSNFSRVYKTKPTPFLSSRLNNRCICSGLFLVYSRSNFSSSTINNVNSNVNLPEGTNTTTTR